MKRFVYLDTDTINSYLSQIDDGLLEGSKNLLFNENSESKSQSETEINQTNNMQVGFPGIASFGINAGGNSTETVRSILNTQMGGDILTKKLHDNAYNLLFEHLNKENLIKADLHEVNIGDYVLIKSKFFVVDFDYFLADGFMDNFKKAYPNIVYRDSKINKEIKKTKIKQELLEIDDGLTMIKITSHVLPSSKFILSDDFYVPLDEKFFREKINSIKYKYPGESYIFAQKTGDIGNLLSDQKNLPKKGEVLSTLINAFEGFDTTILNLVGIKPGDAVLNPIAWYYEWN